MKIRNVVHKGLRRLIEGNDTTGVQPAFVPKLRRIVSFLQDMTQEEELRTVPGWRVHMLTGNRRGTWSLTVSANWRITFRVDRAEMEIFDLNFEDYH